MSNADLLPAAVLKRKAVVYVRQSTQAQAQMNLESQRRQYDPGAPLQVADGRTPGSGSKGICRVRAWGIGRFERPVSVVE